MKIVSTNPSRNFEVIGEVEASTSEEVKSAVSKARKALGTWSALTLKKRCDLVQSFVEVTKKRAEEIAQIISLETGRPISSARMNVAGGIMYFEGYIEIAEQFLSPRVTFETATEIHRVFHEPRGVIAVISPWNYPFQNVAWQCGQALIAGNTIVYKNSSENPLFAKLLAELINQSRLPESVFNVVYGTGVVGELLVHQDIDMISFTGSTSTGQKLALVAAEKFIPIVTELGGSAPLIVFEDVVIDAGVIGHIYSRRFKNSGQSCDAVKRLIVHVSHLNEVVDKLSKHILTQKVGDATEEGTEIGPLVSKRQLTIIESQLKDAVDRGAKIVTGGKRPEKLKGAYYLPTLLTNITSDMRVWNEEVFGPVLPIIPFSTEEEAIALANDTIYGLGAHIMTNEKTRFERIAKQLQSGMVAQNKIMYWNPKNPFGGYKKSGMGRLHSEFGFYDVTQVKLVSEEK